MSALGKALGVALALAGVMAAPLQAQTMPKAISGLPDYSYAGYGFGLATLPTDSGTVIDVTQYGAIPDDESDDSQAVLKALEAARAVTGKVTLRFPAGRFIVTSVIQIDRSDMVLEGAGRGKGGTVLYFPRPLKLIDQSDLFAELREYIVEEDKRQQEPANNVDYYFSEYSWSGGFIHVGIPGTRPAPYLAKNDKRDPALTEGVSAPKWSKTLRVVDVSRLKVGQVVQIQWFSTSPDSALIRSLYGKTDLKIGSRHWDGPNRPLVAQATRITGISGNTITLGDPLLHAVSAAQPATMADRPFLTNVGVQNIALDFPDAPSFGHHLEQGYNGIYLTGMFDGWVRDVTINNADAAILTYDSASLTIRNVTVSGERRGHYAVHVGNAHNVLVKDLLLANRVLHPLTVNTQSTRAVYTGATVLQESIIDQHSGANHENLFDNSTLHLTATRGEDGWSYPLWDGSGAGYWKPNHGLYNTTWNIRVIDESGARGDDTVTLTGKVQGPGHTVVGLHGNRTFRVDYTPAATVEGTGSAVIAAPSLYDYQLARRRK